MLTCAAASSRWMSSAHMFRSTISGEAANVTRDEYQVVVELMPARRRRADDRASPAGSAATDDESCCDAAGRWGGSGEAVNRAAETAPPAPAAAAPPRAAGRRAAVPREATAVPRWGSGRAARGRVGARFLSSYGTRVGFHGLRGVLDRPAFQRLDRARGVVMDHRVELIGQRRAGGVGHALGARGVDHAA